MTDRSGAVRPPRRVGGATGNQGGGGAPPQRPRAQSGGPAGPAKKPGLKEKALHEARKFLILFVYLWLLFGLIALNQAVADRQFGVAVAFQGVALINALLLAKFMLLIESLEIGRWLKGRPIAMLIVFEALNCTILFIVFHVVEHIAMGLFHGEPLSDSMPSLGGGGLVGALIIGLIVFVSLIPFYALKNVARVIGEDRLKEILFRDRRNWQHGATSEPRRTH